MLNAIPPPGKTRALAIVIRNDAHAIPLLLFSRIERRIDVNQID